MNVRDLMTTDPEACLPADSCAQVAQAMRRRNCGFVPIIENQLTHRVIGVVTDRDLALHLCAVDRSAQDVPVSECMRTPVTTIGPEASLADAALVMEQCAIHRLPVVENGRLIGVFSLKNLARQAYHEWSAFALGSAERQLTEIVEAIAAAR